MSRIIKVAVILFTGLWLVKSLAPELFKRMKEEAEDRIEELELPNVEEKVEKIEKVVKKVAKHFGTKVNLNARQEQIYQLVKSGGQLSMPQIASKVKGVSTRTLRRDATILEKLGLVEQVGRTKDTYYKIKK